MPNHEGLRSQKPEKPECIWSINPNSSITTYLDPLGKERSSGGAVMADKLDRRLPGWRRAPKVVPWSYVALARSLSLCLSVSVSLPLSLYIFIYNRAVSKAMYNENVECINESPIIWGLH